VIGYGINASRGGDTVPGVFSLMRNPPARLTVACGLIALLMTLTVGLNAVERGLGSLLGCGDGPAVAYFSRCGPGTYDLAVLGYRWHASLVLPVGRISAAGRTIHLTGPGPGGAYALTINAAPTALRPGDIDRAWTVVRARVMRALDGAGEVVRRLVRLVKS